MVQPIQGDARQILRQLLYDSWNLGSPLAKADIATKNFVVDKSNHVYQRLAVSVRRMNADFKILSTGPTPLRIVWDRLAIGCWTQLDSQLETMVNEAIRIVDANRGISASGVDDLICEGRTPVDNLTERDSVIGEDVRVLMQYVAAT